ncbi:hypothetical protein AK812_SmicGene40999 [Symbiodinium microadriaticum]|uniref:Uncharacterized protein n=1 Tax=Symbiodinium microadriaticum TaxID=2951 RepID=A0A1Q9C7A5_SYMMI|nr:hypothetical protein AK812_SmicGene40999 [Symbiodinium microadriaticum]CAE7204906.1 unnamed protein product [Symbiodinium sp. KB8]CAE7808763.1 unnamed protein product [Symbiodinium microadriaticum]
MEGLASRLNPAKLAIRIQYWNAKKDCTQIMSSYICAMKGYDMARREVDTTREPGILVRWKLQRMLCTVSLLPRSSRPNRISLEAAVVVHTMCGGNFLRFALTLSFLGLGVGRGERSEPAEERAVITLLQQKLVLSQMHSQSPEERLHDAEPMSWLHFPKAGSSFINAMIHLPGVCPGMDNRTLGHDLLGDCWLTKWKAAVCPNACDPAAFVCPEHPFYEKHPTISNYSAQRGKLMAMFRDPDQRILSGYHDDDNNLAAIDYADYLEEDLRIQNCTYFGSDVPKRNLLDFAESWKGGMAYQIVTEHPVTQTLHPNRPSTTRDQAEEAARRVREGFAFVGISEEWDLSICLFHKMFGGVCEASNFVDTRPSSDGKSADSDYDTSVLMGWHDDLDELVYEAALSVFRKSLISFNVSHETCQECYRHAGFEV